MVDTFFAASLGEVRAGLFYYYLCRDECNIGVGMISFRPTFCLVFGVGGEGDPCGGHANAHVGFTCVGAEYNNNKKKKKEKNKKSKKNKNNDNDNNINNNNNNKVFFFLLFL